MAVAVVPWAQAQQTGGTATLSRQSAMDPLDQLEALQGDY